jgi:hypothetical protein
MSGAYSDIPRYVQTMPGVSADSNQRNTYMVRGGNTNESLFVINGFEAPNINHLSAWQVQQVRLSVNKFTQSMQKGRHDHRIVGFTADKVLAHSDGWVLETDMREMAGFVCILLLSLFSYAAFGQSGARCSE